MRVLCFYHRVDFDGKCSAAITSRALSPLSETPVELVGVNHGEDFDKTVFSRPELKDSDVYVVDFSFPLEQMRRLRRSCRRLVWIDHHISAMRKLTSMNDLDGLRDSSNLVSGCELCWRYFAEKDQLPKPVPRAVEYLSKYDVGRWEEDEEVLNFQMGMRSYETSLSTATGLLLWRTLLGGDSDPLIDRLCSEGTHIVRYVRRFEPEVVKHSSFLVPLLGGVWRATNMNRSSWITKAEIEAGVLGELRFHWDPKSKKWNIGFSSVRDDVDCSLYAAELGRRVGAEGGGHKGAAGVSVPELPFDLRRVL